MIPAVFTPGRWSPSALTQGVVHPEFRTWATTATIRVLHKHLSHARFLAAHHASLEFVLVDGATGPRKPLLAALHLVPVPVVAIPRRAFVRAAVPLAQGSCDSILARSFRRIAPFAPLLNHVLPFSRFLSSIGQAFPSGPRGAETVRTCAVIDNVRVFFHFFPFRSLSKRSQHAALASK